MTNDLPKAILFDLDDTIIRHEKPDLAWKRVMAGFSARLEGIDTENLTDDVLEYRDWFWSDPDRHRQNRLNQIWASQQILSTVFGRAGIDDAQLVADIANAYANDRRERMELFPDSLETLSSFRDLGVRLALVTNGASEIQRHKIETFKLATYFEHIVIEGEFGTGKPDERVYRHVLERFDAQPRDAWMVGDNLEWEVATPQRLGMTGIWVDARRVGLPESSEIRPDRIIHSVSELMPNLY